MPAIFPTLDPETGELEDVTYYDVREVGELLHISPTTVRRRILDGKWPHTTLGRNHWMSTENVAWVVAQSTVEAAPFPGIPEGIAPRLGIPVEDRDLEGIR